MGFVKFNLNPCGLEVDDCVIRAIAASEHISWREAYIRIVATGLELCDKPDSNKVWSRFLYSNGYIGIPILNSFKNNYTIQHFCQDNPNLEGILATGTHVVYFSKGNYYDTWDCGNKIPIYFFMKGDTHE